MANFKLDKQNIFVFLLFLFPAIQLVNITNNALYSYTMNSEIMFKLVSYVSLLIITSLLVLIYSFAHSKFKNELFRKIFKIIIILVSICFIFIVLGNILVYELFRYDSCGKEFNNKYIESGITDDYSFCFNKNIQLNYVMGFKGGAGCKTPNKDSISVFRPRTGVDSEEKTQLENRDFETQVSSCINSFAAYTKNISICNKQVMFNEKLTEEDKKYFTDSKLADCIDNYAILNKEWQICDLLLETRSYYKQSEWEQCIKVISWRTNDKSLCEKIPSTSYLRNACLEG